MNLKKLVGVASVSLMCLGGASLPAYAEVETYTLDKAHTNAIFFISHLGFSDMLGRFGEIDGGFELDRDNFSNSKVSVTLKTESLSTFHEKRDQHLKSPDFFNVAEFPEITFVSTGLEKTGDNTAKLTGDFTLLGVTKPVTLDLTLNREGLHTFNKKDYVAGFTATGTIKRSDYGMNFGLIKDVGIGDEVELRIEAEGIRQ